MRGTRKGRRGDPTVAACLELESSAPLLLQLQLLQLHSLPPRRTRSPRILHAPHSRRVSQSAATQSTLSPMNSSAEGCSVTWMSAPTCEAVKRVQPSMLRIVAVDGPSKEVGTGVAVSVAGETVAITAASLIGRSQSVEVSGPSGDADTVRVLGEDQMTGIAVVQVPWAMPVVPIAQQPVSAGQLLVLACLSQSSDVLVPAMGEVNEPSATGGSELMDAINVDISPVATPGGVLLNSSGEMLGLLGATRHTSSDDVGEFVPSWLAVGVATKLTTAHEVVHGWLDMKGKNSSRAGAVVVSVRPSGPAAAAGLKPGDVVVGISTPAGKDPIASMADLQGRLYLEPPGARVELDVVRGDQHITLSPVLTAVHP